MTVTLDLAACSVSGGSRSTGGRYAVHWAAKRVPNVPFLVYEVAGPDGNTLVTHVDEQGGFIAAFEVEPDEIGTPGCQSPSPLEMIVNRPAGEFTEKAGFRYEPIWGIWIHDDACTGFKNARTDVKGGG